MDKGILEPEFGLTSWNDEADLISRGVETFGFDEREVGCEIICYLSQDSCPIDRIDTAGI